MPPQRIGQSVTPRKFQFPGPQVERQVASGIPCGPECQDFVRQECFGLAGVFTNEFLRKFQS